MPVHAIRIHGTGGPEALRFEAVDLPRPGPGEALVLHTAVGVNFIDVYHRRGLYPLPGLPSGLGVEAAGVVEAVGEGTGDFRPGDRVAYVATPPGTYAEARVVPVDRLVPLPDGIDDETAAASLLKGMTAEYLIFRTVRLERGATVLWHAAAGGVGLLACQWLEALGVRVIGTVSTREKAEIARAAGCTWPIVIPEEDFVARVRQITNGRGVPVVFDSVGRDTFDGSLECLERRGTLVAFGNASGPPAAFDPLRLARGSLYLTRPSLFDYVATRDELLRSADRLFGAILRGDVQVQVLQRWPLREAAAAHRALEARRTAGSIVLRP